MKFNYNPCSIQLYDLYIIFLTVTQGDCKCGNVAVDDKQTGLASGSLNRPWMVKFSIVLQSQEMIVCSGSLLNRRWIISAAHCFCALYEVSSSDSAASSLLIICHQHFSSRTAPRESGASTRYSARNTSLAMGRSLRNLQIRSLLYSGQLAAPGTTLS